MLQTQTVEPRTLELLRMLQREPLMSSFNLVGGTALALRIGHRKSIDLDFFTKEEFDIVELREMLVEKYAMTVSFERGQTLKGFIDGVMIDCIRFNYPHIKEPDIFQRYPQLINESCQNRILIGRTDGNDHNRLFVLGIVFHNFAQHFQRHIEIDVPLFAHCFQLNVSDFLHNNSSFSLVAAYLPKRDRRHFIYIRGI